PQGRGHALVEHPTDRQVNNARGEALPSEPIELLHSGFFDRSQRIGPMNMIDVNVIGSKPAQRILDLPHDAGAAGIATYSSTLPLKSDLGGDTHARAQPTFGDRPADNVFGAAESLD